MRLLQQTPLHSPIWIWPKNQRRGSCNPPWIRQSLGKGRACGLGSSPLAEGAPLGGRQLRLPALCGRGCLDCEYPTWWCLDVPVGWCSTSSRFKIGARKQESRLQQWCAGYVPGISGSTRSRRSREVVPSTVWQLPVLFHYERKSPNASSTIMPALLCRSSSYLHTLMQSWE